MNPSMLLRVLVVLLLLAAAGEFAARGSLRFAGKNLRSDMTPPCLGAHAWIEGVDPYDPEAIAPFIEGFVEDWRILVAYPPSTFVVLLPVTLLDWPTTHATWTILSLIAALAVIVVMMSLSELKWRQPPGLLLLALLLALAPMHSALGVGQPVVPAAGLAVVGFWLMVRGRMWSAGVLIALACAVKPQIGGVFLLYALVTLRWRCALTAASLFGLIAVVGIGRFVLLDIDWLNGLRDSITQFVGNGFYRDDPKRFDLINLHVLLHQFIDQAQPVKWIVRAVAVLGSLAFLWLWRRAQPRAEELLCISVPVVLSLLVVYHRFYDAMLLVFPATWAVTRLSRGFDWMACLALFCCLVFLGPGGTVLRLLVEGNRIPETISQSMLWNSVVMPHQIWALLVLLATLIAALARERRRTA